jgi:hypothetical protein
MVHRDPYQMSEAEAIEICEGAAGWDGNLNDGED